MKKITCVFSSAFILTLASISGQTIWNDGTGDWFTPGNWTPPGPPTATDQAQINNGGTAQIAAPGAAAQRLVLGNNTGESGTLSVTGPTATLDVSLNLTVGELGTGTVNISAGAVVTADSPTLGNNSGSIGTLTVDGTGSKLTQGVFAGVADVGDFGTGTLTISNGASLLYSALVVGDDAGGNGTVFIQSGGTANTAGSGASIGNSETAVGVVTVTGTNSKWTSGRLDIGISGTGTLNVLAGGNVTSTSARIGIFEGNPGNSGAVTVNGTNSTWTLSSTLDVGVGGTGTLNITGGGAVSGTEATIGTNTDSHGTVTVNGTGSTWTNSGTLTIGNVGNGTLAVTNGGTVSAGLIFIASEPDSTGTATVDGIGSVLKTTSAGIAIGFSGDGTLNVRNGGLMMNSGNAQLGSQSGSVGTVNVNGTGSKWTNGGNVGIGADGDGTMNITNGGEVTNVDAIVGSGGFGSPVSGTATVDGIGSKWTNSGSLTIGEFALATGTLHIQNGGLVTDTNGTIGQNEGSVGSVTVDGAGSTWTTTSLYVGGDSMGPQGTGLLRIQNGGVVNGPTTVVWSTGTLEIGANPTLNSASLTFDGGTLRSIANTTFSNNITLAAGGMRVEAGALLTPASGNTATLSGVLSGPGGLFKFGAGAFILTNDNTYTGITNVNQGSLIVDGSVTSNVNVDALLGGTGTINGNIGNGGVVSPGELGASAGTLTSSGNYTQLANATLRIEIGGLGMGQHDLLLINPGTASLAGTLQVLQLNGFIPHAGDSFTVLQATGGISNKFDAVTSNFPGVLQPHAVYNPTFVDVVFALGSFNVGGLTPNQLAIAHQLNEIASDPLATDLIDSLVNVPVANLPHDYDLIAPEELASIYEIGFSQTVVQNMNLQHRMDDIRAGSTGFCGNWQSRETGKDFGGSKGGEMAPTGAVLQPAPDNRWGVFATGSGDFVNVDGDFNAHGYDITTGSFTVGADYRIGSHFAIGVDGGYSGSNADLVDNGEVEVDGGKAGAYATVYGFKILGSNVHVDGAVGGGWNSYDTHRTGLEELPVRGSTNGSQFNAMVSYGADWIFGCLDIGTWSTIQYTDLSIDGFTESGSLAPLHIEGQDEDSLVGSSGVRVAYDWHWGNMIIRPEARAAWMHESNDRSYPIDAHLASGAGDTFTVHGPKIGRDAALVDAGVALQWNSRVSTYVYYDGVLGRSNYNNNSVSGGFRVSF